MFYFGDMPEELKEMIERQHMEAQADQADLDRVIETMQIDDLLVVRRMLRIVATNGAHAAAFFDGQIYARLRANGLCVNCGQPDHDHEALAQELADAAPPPVDEPAPGQLLIPGTEFTEEQHRQMAEYGLDDLRDEDTHQLLGFICLNCGMRYPSIEDRMLRNPDDCSGCHIKSAHG